MSRYFVLLRGPVGTFGGSLKNGITISVSAPGVLTGSLTLYHKDKALRLKYKVTIFKKTFEGDIKLLPLPL